MLDKFCQTCKFCRTRNCRYCIDKMGYEENEDCIVLQISRINDPKVLMPVDTEEYNDILLVKDDGRLAFYDGEPLSVGSKFVRINKRED